MAVVVKLMLNRICSNIIGVVVPVFVIVVQESSCGSVIKCMDIWACKAYIDV